MKNVKSKLQKYNSIKHDFFFGFCFILCQYFLHKLVKYCSIFTIWAAVGKGCWKVSNIKILIVDGEIAKWKEFCGIPCSRFCFQNLLMDVRFQEKIRYMVLKTINRNQISVFFYQTVDYMSKISLTKHCIINNHKTSWGWTVPSSVKIGVIVEVVIKVSSWSC